MAGFEVITEVKVEAATLEEALDKAKTQVYDEYAEPCDGASYERCEFELSGDDGAEYFHRVEPERAAEIAASTLLGALRLGVKVAQEVLARWERGDMAEAVHALADWLSQAESAIHQACENTEGAP
jgi:hypothetical protein